MDEERLPKKILNYKTSGKRAVGCPTFTEDGMSIIHEDHSDLYLAL